MTLAREKREKNKKKSNSSFVVFIFLYIKTYILLEKTFEETNAVTPTPIQIFIGFVDTIRRSKILGNRLGILT